MRREVMAAGALVLLVLAARAGAAASGGTAVDAVDATLGVEHELLREDLDQREQIAVERTRASARLLELYTELDATFHGTEGLASKAIEDALGRVERIESERRDLVAAERILVDRILERQRRIDLLEERLALLQERAQEEAGPLSGPWDVVLLPADVRGNFTLQQNGTLVSGTYTLEGGWTGNLQGTFIQRKLRLERIDSKLGRAGEFEGFLSSDRSRIRGTWRSYELAADQSAQGQWSATRSADRP